MMQMAPGAENTEAEAEGGLNVVVSAVILMPIKDSGDVSGVFGMHEWSPRSRDFIRTYEATDPRAVGLEYWRI
ncbi:hypothetical protein CRV24_000087 [Beauveria bassiana]|nr:hypothetical protein CRV24_000087 [Beauveria bassiana]KAH8721397.1 hypothetical protein HC256_001755 [Beauveria bassiana]